MSEEKAHNPLESQPTSNRGEQQKRTLLKALPNSNVCGRELDPMLNSEVDFDKERNNLAMKKENRRRRELKIEERENRKSW